MSTTAPVTNVTSAVLEPWIQTVPAVFTILGCIFLVATILICLNLTFCKAWWERTCSCCGGTGFEKVVSEDEVEGTLWLPDDDGGQAQNRRTDIYKVPLVDHEAWQDGGQSSRPGDQNGPTEEELDGLVMSAGVKGSVSSLRSPSALRQDDVMVNSTELIDLEEEVEPSHPWRPDTAGSLRPDTAGSVKPDTAGSFRPGTVGSIRPSTVGSSRPGTGGSLRPGTSGSIRPGTSGSLRPGTAGSLRPGTASSARPGTASSAGRSSARLRRPVSAGSGGRETAEERWGKATPESLTEEEERQRLLATLPLSQRQALQQVKSLVEVRAQLERWKNKNRMKRRQNRVAPELPPVETVSTSSDTLSSGSARPYLRSVHSQWTQNSPNLWLTAWNTSIQQARPQNCQTAPPGEDQLQNVWTQWVESRSLLSSTTLGTVDSATPTARSTPTSVRSARTMEVEPRQNGRQSASFAAKSPPKTATSNRLEIISEDDDFESRITRSSGKTGVAKTTPRYGRRSQPKPVLSTSSWDEYHRWAESVSSGRRGKGAPTPNRMAGDTVLPRSGGSRTSTSPTVYRYSFRGSDILSRQTSQGTTALPFPEPSLTDLPDLLPGSIHTTTYAAKDSFGWVDKVPIPTDPVVPPAQKGPSVLDVEKTSLHGDTKHPETRAPPSGRSSRNYTPSFDFRQSGDS